jgi:tetratricopeptide (TPR) repeat protein
MRSNFDQSEKLLRVADTILKTFLENTDDLSPVVEMRLGDLAITFEHHSGVLALHTNRPSDSLRHLRKHVTMLEDRSAHRPTENDSQWGVAHNELGNAYLQNNNAVIAEECFRTSIDVLNDLESTNTNTLTMPQINLGFSLWLQGRLDEAADEFAEVLRQRKLAYGENDAVSFAQDTLTLAR